MKRGKVSLPEVLTGGESARLFPVLAETSREGRTTSVFLACLALVPAFGRVLLEPLGQRVGNRTSIQTYTEVSLAKSVDGQPNRPDGLIAISRGATTWTALLEAKVRRSSLDADQVTSYLQLARDNGIDAVITVSNDFAAVPSHHPLQMQVRRLPKNVSLFHWSWASVLTHAKLLLTQGVDAPEQRIVLTEFVRYLEHPSSGVMRFDSMGPDWRDIVASVTAGARLNKTSDQVVDTVASWHQETRDLALRLTELVNANVAIRLSRPHRDNSGKRIADDSAFFSDAAQLRAEFDVPDAASPITVVVDVQRRSIEVSMWLNAPTDRRSTTARVNWLLRQLAKSDGTDLHVAAAWPRRAKKTQEPLISVRDDPRCLQHEDGSLAPVGFEIKMVRDVGGRFSKAKTFVDELEATVFRFYEQVGQRLKRWQPAAPRMAETVSSSSMPRMPDRKAEQPDGERSGDGDAGEVSPSAAD